MMLNYHIADLSLILEGVHARWSESLLPDWGCYY